MVTQYYLVSNIQYLGFNNACLWFHVWVGCDRFLTTVWFKMIADNAVVLKLHTSNRIILK